MSSSKVGGFCQGSIRRRQGLQVAETRTREWLLLLEFRKCETFAYSCEAYGWMVEHAQSRLDRIAMGQEFASRASRFADESVDPAELADIVREACDARNGWKVVLRRCAAAKTTRREVMARLPQGAGSRVEHGGLPQHPESPTTHGTGGGAEPARAQC